MTASDPAAAPPLTLVTGGAGFIGSHIVRRLASRNERVRVLDNFATGRRENLKGAGSSIEIVEDDLRDAEAVRNAARDVDFVLHLGALGSVQRSVDDPFLTNDVNVNGTLNVLVAARDAHVKRVVFASSSSVYGDTKTLPKIEDMPVAPRSPYAASKLAGEGYCRAFDAAYGLETACLRYFNVFGPGQDPDSRYAAVVPRFVTAMLAGRRPTIYGDGAQSRDFTYVANVADATIAARTAKGARGGVHNIACGSPHTLLDLVAAINETIGADLPPAHDPPRPGDVRHSHADISSAASWGYRPRVLFAQGLAETVEYFRSRTRSNAK